MELHQLRIFLEVASVRNFTKAAERLSYSQSNISAQIRQLEREMGQPLFNRIGRHVSLTQYGEQLLPHARELLYQAGAIEDMFRDDKEIAGTLRLGMVDSLCRVLLVSVMAMYHRRFPRMLVDLSVDSTDALMEQVRKDQLDFACVIHDPVSDPEWNSWDTAEMPVGIIASTDSPLAQKKAVYLEDLAGASFVMMERGAPYSSYFQHMMLDRKIPFQTILTLQDPDMACRLVAAGGFLSVVPIPIAAGYVERKEIALLAVENFSFAQYAQILLHTNKNITPQIRGMMEAVHEAFCSLF